MPTSLAFKAIFVGVYFFRPFCFKSRKDFFMFKMDVFSFLKRIYPCPRTLSQIENDLSLSKEVANKMNWQTYIAKYP